MSRRLTAFKIQAENMYLVESDVKEYIALLFIIFSSLYESFFNKKSLKKVVLKL